MLTSFALTLLMLNPAPKQLRPVAVPLILHDPYFSIWSPSEILNSAETRHWTGAPHTLSVVATVDGQPYRLVGKSGAKEAMKQVGLSVSPTTTTADFHADGTSIRLQFITPCIPTDLRLMSTPLSYITWQVTGDSSKKVSVRVSASGMIAASGPEQSMNTARTTPGTMSSLAFGTVDQPVLGRTGDDTQIDWGTCYLAGPTNEVANAQFTGGNASKSLSAVLDFQTILAGDFPTEQFCVLAYDDNFSIQYFGQNLRPYWRTKKITGETLIQNSPKNFAKIRKQCQDFDAEFTASLEKAGGQKYAEIGALAFRQAIAGCKLAADPNGQPLLFPKENTSNGCIATSDVIYPFAPHSLLFGSAITRAFLTPIMAYGQSERWKFPFAPHDLGTYPKANAQVYGGGERTEENQMPVEESANMLILVAALAKIEGNASYAKDYWPTLTRWANYLSTKGFDPENQLCTDDFLGHLAHNVNLSCKAILGLRSYAMLAEMLGYKTDAEKFRSESEGFATRWVKEAADGDHTRLTFDKAGTWSQKYNLVWDKILGFNLFPDTVRASEMKFYRRKLNEFGLPLDSRGTGAKLDWSIWTATLTQNADDFAAIMDGVYQFIDRSPDRVGMGDWYNTASGRHNFMHSRPVVGGVFLQLLYDVEGWKKWSSKSVDSVKKYAPIPPRPVIKTVVPAGDSQAIKWRYSLSQPANDWVKTGFDDVSWQSGESGFGTRETPGVTVRTLWDSSDIWIRRSFELPKTPMKNLKLWLHHDDNVEVFLNGVLAYQSRGWTSEYEAFDILPGALKTLKPGANNFAIHCHQNAGGQYIDAGLVTVEAK